MTTSVYIHIPFCKQKCNYCSFISFASPEKIELYTEKLNEEIKHYYKGEVLKTLYLGGGTPSLLSPEQVKKIISNFNISSDAEITMELNPEKITKEYLKELKNTGINRLSIGCQSFDENILKAIGRKHSPNDVEFVIKKAQDIGFNNISLDFIYGLPDQTKESFINDLNRAKNLDIQHISLYGLKIEEGCYFYKNPPKNLSDEDLQAEMYLDAIKTLSDFEHYEISNFAKKGFHSKHNLTYWNNENYYGFGISAHGYENNIRYSNKNTLEEYFKNPLEKNSQNTLTKQEQLEEEIFLGFRRMSGLNTNSINQKFNINFEKKYKNILEKFLKSQHIKKTSNGYALTIDGVLVSNIILSEFLE